jgi:hypothetical protein
VRSYLPGDHGSLVRLWSRVFPDDPPRNAPEAMIRNKERVQPELLLVATLEEAIVGAVIAGFDGTRGWIYHLAVDSSFAGGALALPWSVLQKRGSVGSDVLRSISRFGPETKASSLSINPSASKSNRA